MVSPLKILLAAITLAFSFVGSARDFASADLLDMAYEKAYDLAFNGDSPLLPNARRDVIDHDVRETSIGDNPVYLPEEVDSELRLKNVETIFYPAEPYVVPMGSGDYDIANPSSFYGHIKWETPGGYLLPAKGLVLSVYREGWLGDTIVSPDYAWTDSDGFYNIIFENFFGLFDGETNKMYLRIFAMTYYFSVTRDYLVTDSNYYLNTASAEIFPNYHKMLDVTIKYEDSDAYKAFFISQIMTYAGMAFEYFSDIDLEYKGIMNVNYPGFSLDQFGVEGNYNAYVKGRLINIVRDDWSNLGTLIHELTHYILDKAGNLKLSLDDYIRNGPGHSSNIDNLEEKGNKDYARQLTYNEAVADTVPLLICDLYYYDLEALATRNLYEGDDQIRRGHIDDVSESFNNIKREIRDCLIYFSAQENKGEFQEASLKNLFYNLFGDGNSPDDSGDIGPESFLDLITRPDVYTLDGFLSVFWDESPEMVEESAEILEKCNISPNDFRVDASDLQSANPAFSWNSGGSNNHPNNVFDIEFYSRENEELFEFEDVDYAIDGDTLRYAPAAAAWGDLKKAVKDELYVYCRVVGYNDEQGILTGPFPSASQLIYVNPKVTLAPDDFGFEDAYPSEEVETYLSVSDLDITVFRLRCGFIQEEAINLCPRKEGAGTAYLLMSFSKTVCKAAVEMSYWTADERFLEDDEFVAGIYVHESGGWVQAVDLIEADLPTNRTFPKTIEIISKLGFSEICFYVRFDKMTGYTDRNKGRISIFDMEFYYDKES